MTQSTSLSVERRISYSLCAHVCCTYLPDGSESASKTGMIMVLGEITTTAKLDFQKIIRGAIKRIGYDDVSKGMF